MDHYNVLGISRNASKDEIKQAYRRLAMQFHPDKHAQSPSNLKEAATLKFKLISQAYDTLIDDHTRSDYNIRRSTNQNHYNTNYNTSTHHYYNTYYAKKGYYHYGHGSAPKGGAVRFKMDLLFSFLNTKAFFLNAAFVGFLLAGSVVISSGGHTLWEMQNSGKSFEDAMESIEKAKKFKDKT